MLSPIDYSQGYYFRRNNLQMCVKYIVAQFWVREPYRTCATRPAAMGDSRSSTGRIDPRNYQLYVQKNAYFNKDSQG